MKKVLLFIGMLISASMIFAQTATMRIADVDLTGYSVGQDVFVPVYVDAIDDGTVYTMQFFVGFNHSILTWKGSFANPTTGIVGFHPNFPYGTTAGSWMFNDNGTELVTLWDDPANFHTFSIPTQNTWYTMIFTYNGGLVSGMSSPLVWGLAATDQGGKLVKGPTEMYDQNFSQYVLTLVDGSVFLPGGDPPVADFMGAPVSGIVPLTVNFTDMSTNAPHTWAWTFGDGGNSALQNPTYVYNTPGVYTVSLTATNDYGFDTETKIDYITVLPVPCTPGLWDGEANDGDWFNPLNWDCDELPLPGVDVTIPPVAKAAPPVIVGGPVIVGALTILPGGSLSLGCVAGGPCGELTTNGVFTNNGDFYMYTENSNGYSATFINLGPIIGGGNFYYTRDMLCTGTTMNGLDPNWHYLAAPMDGFSTHSMFDYYVNAWDADPLSPTFGNWVHVEGMAPGCIPGPNVPLAPMEAWSVNYALDYTCTGGTGLNLEFMGGAAAMHTGPYAKPFGYGAAGYQMWNLFGNPYPSGLEMSAITWDPNLVQGAAYWDGCFGGYLYWTPALGAYSMAPGLGFFTEATAPGVFALAGTERAHGADWFWKSEVSNLVTLKAEGNDRSDLTHIRFMDNASPAFEKTGDFHKLFVDGAPMIYTVAGADQLAVNVLPATAIVPMNFTSTVSGTFTISAIETSDFANVVLEDRTTGEKTDLLTSSYTFDYATGSTEERFFIHFTGLGTPELSANSISIWASNQTIYVQAPATTGDIVVYNMMGQEVLRTDIVPGLNEIPMKDVNTYYIVKVLGSDITETGKVFIK